MPSTHLESASNFGTPRANGQIHTPRNHKVSRSKGQSLLTQPLRIGYQKVNIDVDLQEQKIIGATELTVLPMSSQLRSVKLDCREMTIKDIYINNSRTINYIYKDMLYINDEKYATSGQAVNLFDLYNSDVDIYQHHLLRQKLNYIFGEIDWEARDSFGNTEELTILLPDNLKLELTGITSALTPSGHANTTTPLHLKSKSTHNDTYTPIHIKIEYEAVNCKNGVNFITPKNQDKKSWHAYTTNSAYNISTSSWVPCIDNLWERYIWSIEVNIPRTIKDIGNTRIIGAHDPRRRRRRKDGETQQRNDDEVNEVDDNDNDDDDDDDSNYDLVVCSGDFNNIKETPHPIDLSKKVVSWSIFNPVCAHHVGWTIGCFESFTLAENEDEEDEEMDYLKQSDDVDKDTSKSPVIIYALHDQVDLARNTCIFANKAMDFFVKEFGSYPFSSYAIVFVSKSASACNSFAGLSIVDDTMLYPPDIIEPIFKSTETILESIASQWSGINIVPQTFNDIWCTLGIAKYMSFQYLKKLMGNNYYRFKIKTSIDTIVKEDIGQKPLASQFFRYPICDDDLSFVRLKAPVVLFILDRRMTKTDKSFGLSRVLPKLFLQAISGDLQNSTLTTQHFQYVCEKVNRNKLEIFFKQWVFGVGTPIFNIVQKFNKKRGVIEMIIRQTQHQETKKVRPKPNKFINDSISYLENEPLYPVQPVFLGPMTIRVHESDGSPYEHIVDLKEGQTKIEIQYNSKFKRLKKVKEEMGEVGNTFRKLGDILDSPEEKAKWDLADWIRYEEDILNEPFEWIRVDVDFEWIAKFNMKQSDYMYGSQLQYDKDLEAQYEAIKYFGEIEKPGKVHCSALVRTILDKRYHYGVRIEAARALVSSSNPENNLAGLGYLLKAYKELFCFKGSSIPLSNDFGDFGDFFVKKEVPMILSQVRDSEGNVPIEIKDLLLNLIRFNENSNNQFQDCFYVSSLIESLTNCIVGGENSGQSVDESLNVNGPLSAIDFSLSGSRSLETPSPRDFPLVVVHELNRLHKLDQWTHSYHSVISKTCLHQKVRLCNHGTLKISFEDLLYYTLDKYDYDIRIEAFRGLLILGGLKNSSVLAYFLKTCLLETSGSYFRSQLISLLTEAICVAAIEGTPSTLDDEEFKPYDKLTGSTTKVSTNLTNMVIIEDGSNNEMDSKRDTFARATLNGAIEILRRDYSIGRGLKNVLWELIHSSQLSIIERRDVFSICQVLYREIDKFVVKISVPHVPVQELKKKIVLKYLGEGKIMIKREGRFKIQLLNRKLTTQTKANLRADTSATQSTTEPKLKLSLGAKQALKRASKKPKAAEDYTTQDEPAFVDSLPSKAPTSSSRRQPITKPAPVPGPPAVTPPPLTASKSTRLDPMVTFDDKFKIKITLRNKKLPVVAPVEIPADAVPVKVGRSSVLVNGSKVTFSLKGAYKSKLRDLVPVEVPDVPKAAHRYVKILTKNKTVSLSATPFPDASEIRSEAKVKAEPESESSYTPAKANRGKSLEPQLAELASPSKRGTAKAILTSPNKSHGNSKSVQVSPAKAKTPSLASPIKTKSSSVPDSSKKIRTKSPLVEPEIKTEKALTPFSRSGSPFSQSPSASSVKKKKTKIYIHSGDSKSLTPTDKEVSEKNGENSGDLAKADPPEEQAKDKPKLGIKLKLNLKR
ncbi:uncharacterized protein CANTADRAFT_24685 [Suhomyces tanzawaensis NRRL Y-17324]|uniref:Transcription initiation factor TFIID subunit 2 n=1 Tax=Suhomyces tanzawaensis NRRL Y-17324 TaxID=984487 RepID=A0A1E4SR31_9ASCO|nr:uncharacterized protein CANTADRAFT_24685 [Suhomyces tanzawaensis NRRL Y-17324]ODV81976.1 hypothetical protein CANTADRAFT_24685 [Suhomyces tanzawaensis NRRL Y-17324]